MEMVHYFGVAFAASLVGLAIVALLFKRIVGIAVTDQKADKIATAIRSGAMTFLREEYKIIAVVVALIAVLIGYFMSLLASTLFVAG